MLNPPFPDASGLIIPPHIEYKLLDLFSIQVPDDFVLSLDWHTALSLGEEKSHAAVESPLSGDGPAEDNGVPREETGER
jgi:hypothetical protein